MFSFTRVSTLWSVTITQYHISTKVSELIFHNVNYWFDLSLTKLYFSEALSSILDSLLS